MITIDDLLIGVAADLADLVRPVTAEVVFGHRDAGMPMGCRATEDVAGFVILVCSGGHE